MTRFELAARWPRVLRMVEEYVGNRNLAVRYVAKAVDQAVSGDDGSKLYVDIVREAFARRHARRPLNVRSVSYNDKKEGQR